MLDGGNAEREPEEDGATDDWRPVCPVPEDAPDPTFRHDEHGEASAHWAYVGHDGRPLGFAVRFDVDTGTSQVLPHTYCSGPGGRHEWQWVNFPKPRPLYRLDQLDGEGVPVLVTVGEEAAEAAALLFPDIATTTSPGATTDARAAGWRCMANRDVVIWAIKNGDGEHYARLVAKECKRAGAREIKIVRVPDVFPNDWNIGDSPPTGWEGDGLRCLVTGPDRCDSDADEAVELLNERHAVVLVGGNCTILNEDWDPAMKRRTVTFSSPTDFRTFHGNHFVRSGNSSKPVGPLWLTHRLRRQYSGVIFSPEEDAPGFYNLWTGFAVEPKPGERPLYLAHLRDNVAGGVEEVFNYIIAWMADAVQNPAKRPGTAIVLRGKQGVGKGICCSQFGKLFGQHFVQVTTSRHLTGNFNAHLKDALIVFADEAFWAGDKNAEGVLKAMVTEEEIHIELKGKDTIRVRNHIRLMIASNHDWVVPAGLEERRFFVVDVGEARMQDREYFQAIVDQMENGGREALLHYLLHYDLSEVDLGVFPQTEALRDQKIRSMTPVQKWWYDRLMDGKIVSNRGLWSEWVSCRTVQEEFISHARDTGYARRATETELGIELHKFVPGLQRTRRMDQGSRPWGYDFPPLSECRAAFDRLTGSKHPWPEDEDPPCPTEEPKVGHP